MIHEITYQDQLRYLFMPEIHEFFSDAGMQCVGSYEHLTENQPGDNTWNAFFIGKVV